MRHLGTSFIDKGPVVSSSVTFIHHSDGIRSLDGTHPNRGTYGTGHEKLCVLLIQLLL